MHERDVVHAGRDVREQLGDILAALAVLLEFPFGPDDPALFFLAAATEGFDGNRFAVQRIKLRFVIKGVDR